MSVSGGQWPTVRALESGSVLLDRRGGRYEVLGGGGFFEVVTVKEFWMECGRKRWNGKEE